MARSFGPEVWSPSTTASAASSGSKKTKPKPASGETPVSRAASRSSNPVFSQVDVPDWARGSQYDIPNVPLIEPTDTIQEGSPAVITSEQANSKLGAARTTVNYANEAMSIQQQRQREIAAARAQEEADKAAALQDQQNIDSDRTLQASKLAAEGKGAADIQAKLDEVKQNILQTTPEDNEKALSGMGQASEQVGTVGTVGTPEQVDYSGYYDKQGQPIQSSDPIFEPQQQSKLRDKIAGGFITTSDDPLEAEFDKRTAQAEKAWEDHNKQVDKLLAGTIPLTTAQQQQVNSLRSDFDELKSEQQKANQNYQGGLATLAATTGQNRYMADQAMGEMNQAINDGVHKIARLDSQAAQTIAAMEDAFQKDNFAIIDKGYDDYTEFLEKRQATISNIQAATAAAVKAERDWNYKVKQDEISNLFKKGDLDLREKQTAIDAAYKDATITLEQKKFLHQELQDNISNRLAAAKFALDRQNAADARTLTLKDGRQVTFDTQGHPISLGGGTVPVMAIDSNRLEAVKAVMAKGLSDPETIKNVLNRSDTGEKINDFTLDEVKDLKMVSQRNPGQSSPVTNSSGVPVQSSYELMNIPGVAKTKNTGLIYFDRSQFTNKEEADQAQVLAGQQGVTMLTPAQVETVRTLDAAIEKLNKYEADFMALAPDSISGKFTQNIKGQLSKAVGNDYGDRLEAYQTNIANLLATLKGINDGGTGVAREAMLERIEESLPRLDDQSLFRTGLSLLNPLVGFSSTDKGSGAAQFNSTRSAMYTMMGIQLPEAMLPASGQQMYKSGTELVAAHPEYAEAAAEAVRHGVSDADVPSVIQR